MKTVICFSILFVVSSVTFCMEEQYERLDPQQKIIPYYEGNKCKNCLASCYYTCGSKEGIDSGFFHIQQVFRNVFQDEPQTLSWEKEDTSCEVQFYAKHDAGKVHIIPHMLSSTKFIHKEAEPKDCKKCSDISNGKSANDIFFVGEYNSTEDTFKETTSCHYIAKRNPSSEFILEEEDEKKHFSSQMREDFFHFLKLIINKFNKKIIVHTLYSENTALHDCLDKLLYCAKYEGHSNYLKIEIDNKKNICQAIIYDPLKESVGKQEVAAQSMRHKFFDELGKSLSTCFKSKIQYVGSQSDYNLHDCARFSLIYLLADLDGFDPLKLSPYQIYNLLHFIEEKGYEKHQEKRSTFGNCCNSILNFFCLKPCIDYCLNKNQQKQKIYPINR
ncbi:MAG: hypothetical protein ACTSXG_01005 [Alphaproteobacteria bacterium]